MEVKGDLLLTEHCLPCTFCIKRHTLVLGKCRCQANPGFTMVELAPVPCDREGALEVREADPRARLDFLVLLQRVVFCSEQELYYVEDAGLSFIHLCQLQTITLTYRSPTRGGTQIWVGQGCAARASKPLPIFKGDFGRNGYPFLRIFLEK